MNIRYWDCEFCDCDSYYNGEEEIWLYGCTHSKNPNSYCGLNNKWNNRKDNCTLLDKEETPVG